MQMFSADPNLVKRHLAVDSVGSDQILHLLRQHSISAGTPVFLDEETMLPVAPLTMWGKHLSYAELDPTTMRDYGRIVVRLDRFLEDRGRTVFTATEADLVAYRRERTMLQQRPIGPSAWSKESSVIDGLYAFLVEFGHLERRPVRTRVRGRNALAPRVRTGMDIRHLTLAQYRYFRDVGLGGQTPDGEVNWSFRGMAPHRSRAGTDLAIGSGMRWQEWSTVLLPELGIGTDRATPAAEFTVQACAKYGKARPIYVPDDAVRAVATFCLLERPDFARVAAPRLERCADELFVVTRIDLDSGLVRGRLEGIERQFLMSAMPPGLRRITVSEGEFGLEAMAVFIGRGGMMLGADSWKEFRHRAWNRMHAMANETTAPMPAKRWRWHDLRHTYALQLLSYLERLLDVDGADGEARRRRHRSYLGGHLRRNPLLIVSRRLGHASPETTFAYLEYTDDLVNEFEAAFGDWVGHDQATYAQIAAHVFASDTDGAKEER